MHGLSETILPHCVFVYKTLQFSYQYNNFIEHTYQIWMIDEAFFSSVILCIKSISHQGKSVHTCSATY